MGTQRGSVAVVDGELVYTPPTGFSGVVTFDYEITDGTSTSTATVTVTVGNGPPVAVDDSTTTPYQTSKRIDVIGNDSDTDGGTLTLESVSACTHGGTVAIVDGEIVYTPAAGFHGTDTFTYVIADGQGGTDTATVTVVVAARVPPAVAGIGNSTGGEGADPTVLSRLARTGDRALPLLATALTLMGCGIALLVTARRRRA